MPSFRIEVYWPDLTRAAVDDVVARTLRAARRHESPVAYVGCEIAPRDETVFIRVTADDEDAVRAFVVGLNLPGARVAAVLDVPPPGG